MSSAPDLAVHLDALNDLFTRSYYSAAGYVFESQPYVVPADADVLDLLSTIRREDRRHAQLLAGVIDDLEAVPLAGAFPWWYRDLNYLSVPCLAGFVVEALREDLARYAAALAALPPSAPGARATLTAIRREKEALLARLAPVAEAARIREAAEVRARIDARKAARAARLAKEKAAKEAAKKAAGKPAAARAAVAAAAPAAAAALDPNEAGITPKERARRQMLAKRGAAAATGAPAAAPSAAAAATAPALDPNEAGISAKERARRQMLAKRGGAAAPAPAAPAPAAAPASPPAVDLPDPDEDGISPKEKARRQMLRKRAASGGAPAPAAAAATPAPAPAPAPAPVEDDLDPEEDGISPKEKARRTMLRKRRAASP